MKKKVDIFGIVGLFLAIFTLVFGDNLYQQIKGVSFFQSFSLPSVTATQLITNNMVVTSTPRAMNATSPASITATQISTPTLEDPLKEIGTPRHPIKIVFIPSLDASTLLT